MYGGANCDWSGDGAAKAARSSSAVRRANHGSPQNAPGARAMDRGSTSLASTIQIRNFFAGKRQQALFPLIRVNEACFLAIGCFFCYLSELPVISLDDISGINHPENFMGGFPRSGLRQRAFDPFFLKGAKGCFRFFQGKSLVTSWESVCCLTDGGETFCVFNVYHC